MNVRFIRWIVTYNKKLVYYRNPDASEQWLAPRQLVKILVKKSARHQSNVCLVKFRRCDSLGICSKRAWSRCGSSFSTTGTSSLNFDTEIELSCSRTMRDPYCTNNHNKTSRIGRNRTVTTLSIQPGSCAFRLPPVSIPDPFLVWKKFRKHWSYGNGSHRNLRIKNHRLALSRDNRPRWKRAQGHRISWSLLSRVL